MPKRWSVKDPVILREATAVNPGVARFVFTDDYSIFHYSKMPDQIPRKGEAVARMAVHSLRAILRDGIPTHMLDFEPPKSIVVKLLRILDPAKGELKTDDRCRLVPLQVIYRNSLPEHASVRSRLASGELRLEDIGLDELPAPGVPLRAPLIEFTTKLEEIDRFLSPAEAQQLARLSKRQFEEMIEMTCRINGVLCGLAKRVGMECLDGKIEFGIDEAGQIMLVDTAGTPDENRFQLDGLDVSKQVLRDQYYQCGLKQDILKWVAEGRPRSTWPKPQPLPSAVIELVSAMYASLCEQWTGETIWAAPALREVALKIKHLQDSKTTYSCNVRPAAAQDQ